MPWYDLPIDELRVHRTNSIEPADLDRFWQAAITEAVEAADEPILTPYRSETYGAIKAYDVTFTGAEGHPIRAWYLRPAGVARELPVSSNSSATEAAAVCRLTTRSIRPAATRPS